MIEKFSPAETNGEYESLCEESYTYTNVNGEQVSAKKNFKTYDVAFGEKNGECLAKVVKVKSGQSGQTCIKVEALLSDGSSISSQSVWGIDSQGFVQLIQSLTCKQSLLILD